MEISNDGELATGGYRDPNEGLVERLVVPISHDRNDLGDSGGVT
jgi:hypothetical protein